MRVSRVTTLSLLALLAAGLALAQTTGSIEGTIIDETGTVLPGVTVEATSPSLQGTKVAVADTEGRFRLVLLPPGAYDVKFTLEGFATTDQNDVKVSLGRIVTLHVAMRSAFKDEVLVTGATPTIDVKSTEVGVNIEQDFFRNIPTGRNYTSVAQVAPRRRLDVERRLPELRVRLRFDRAARTPTTSTASTPPASSSASRARCSTSSSSRRSRSRPAATSPSSAVPPAA